MPENDELEWEAKREGESGFSHIRIVDKRLRERAESGDELAAFLLELRREMPSAEDRAFLREERISRERAAWAWRILRTYVPPLAAIGSAIGAAAYWLVTHVQWRQP